MSDHPVRELVWRYIGLCEERGATSPEVERALGIPHKTVSARINELFMNGRLVRDGRRAVKKGHDAYIYRVPAHALECQTCGLDNDAEAHKAWDLYWTALTTDQQQHIWDALERLKETA